MRTYRRKARIAPSDHVDSFHDIAQPAMYNWTLFIFAIAWLNCLVTPIVIWILQDVPFQNPVVIVGFFCDIIACVKLLFSAIPWPMKLFHFSTTPEPLVLPHVKKNWLLLAVDIIPLFPLFAVPVAKVSGLSGLRLAWFCAPRMIQIVAVWQNFHSWKNMLSRDSVLRNGTVSRVVLVFVLTSIHASALACVWFVISCSDTDECPTSNAWVAEDEVLNPYNLFSRYIRSLHFVMQTLFTIGYGDIAPRSNSEIVFSLFLVLNGSLFYGFLISAITSLISNKDITTKLFRADMATLRQFLVLREIPPELCSRIDGLFNFLFNRQSGLLERHFLGDIPAPLLREMKRSYVPQLEQIPFFAHQSTQLVNQVADRLVLRSYVPKAIVLFENERRRELFLIRFGKLDIKVRTSPNTLFSYMAGEYVGDFQLIFGTPSEVTVESGAYTEVLVLSFEAMVDALTASGAVPRVGEFEGWLTGQQKSLEATIANHKQLLLRVIKVRTSMEEIKKKNKLAEMMADVATEKSWFVIMPDSNLRPVWSMIIICGILYYMLAIPFRILDRIDCETHISPLACLSAWDWSLIVDYAVDIVFIADAIMRACMFAFTRFEGELHVVVTDMHDIFANFTSSKQKYLTIIGVLPLDILALSTGYLMCWRLVKLIWTLQLFAQIGDFLSFFELYRKISLVSTEGRTVLHLSIIAIFVCLWTSICWSLIHLNDSGVGFVESVYWCLTTMTTVGYGDVVPTTNTMTVFGVAACIVCPCTCATIIATVASYVHNTDTSVDNIGHRKLVVQTFLSSIAYDRELKASISAAGKDALSYVDHVSRERHGLDETKLMRTMLPDYMQEDIRQFIVMDVILSLPIFAHCESGFVRQIMLALDQLVVMTSFELLTAGAAPEGMYVIQSGLVQILTAQGRKTQKLSHGDSFAEIYLFEESTFCNFKAQAHTNCEIWYLRRHNFNEIVREIGPRSMKAAVDQMHKMAKNAAKRMVETPAPTIRALQAIHELGAIDNERVFVKPQSWEYSVWVLFVSGIIIYNLISIPARLALMEGAEHIALPTALIDYLGDGTILADVVLRMYFLAYVDRQELILSKSKIWDHYMQTNCIRHVIASLPLDIFALCGVLPGHSLQQTLMFYRLNKLLRVIDLPAYVEAVEFFFLSRSSLLMRNTSRVVKLMFVVFLAAHLVGCLFFAVANQEHRNGIASNWADEAGILRACSFDAVNSEDSCSSPTPFTLMMSQYMHSMYWATATLTTVGYGDIAAASTIERIISLFVFVAGTAVYTMVITNLQDIVSHLDVTSDLFKSRRNRIEKLLVRERAPEELVRKTAMYLDKLWQTQCGAQGNEIKDFLAPNLYSEIVLKLIEPKIRTLFFIKGCSRGFQLDLVQKMDLQLYMAMDFVFHSGEAAMSLYLLVRGDIALVSEDTGQQYSKIFSDKGILGESEFFTRACYSCAAQVMNDVTCYELSYRSLWGLVEQYRLVDSYTSQMRGAYVNLYKTSQSNMVQTLHGNLKNNKMVKMMSVKEADTVVEYAILPDSLQAKCWVVCTTIFVVYQALTVPYCIAFRENILAFAIMDAILFLFFTVDIYLNLRYFAVEENGTLIRSRHVFASRYVDRHIKKDILSSLPVALLIYGVTGNTVTFVLLRMLYLLRLDKINTCINKILGMLESFVGGRFSSDYIRVVKTILLVWYVGHVTACLLCLIGQTSDHSWIYENEFEDLSALSIYLRGFFWAMYTIVTVGYGNIQLSSNVERAFAACVMIMGAILCDAGMTAVLSSIIGNADKQSGVTRRSRDAMLRFCQSNQMSVSICSKVNAYYDYLATSLNNSVEDQDFALLPKPILQEFVQFSTLDAICSLCLLDVDSSEHRLGFVYSIIRYAVPTIALPTQAILRDSDDADLHILRRGRAFARYYQAQCAAAQKDYFQEGEALCREGRLNTSSSMAPGKRVKVVLGSVSGLCLGPNTSGPFGSSSVYARIGVGARKARSSARAASRGAVAWKESFVFHAPKAAPSLALLLFDDKATEGGGFIGRCDIQFDELESMEVHEPSVELTSTSLRRPPPPHEDQSPQEGDSRRVVTFTNVSGGRLNSLPEFTDTNTGDGQLNTEDDEYTSGHSYSYHVKQDVRDKNGRLKGIVDLEITMRNVGVSDDSRCRNTYLKCRQKSTKSVEVIAETVCHLFTIEAARLNEIREYYLNFLDPSRRMSIGVGGVPRKRRKSSFIHANMMDIMKRQQPSSAGKLEEESASSRVPERRGGIQNCYRRSECVRTGELLISHEVKSGRTRAQNEDNKEEDDDEDDDEHDCEGPNGGACFSDSIGGEGAETNGGNLTTEDFSDGEMQEAFGLSPLVQDLKRGNDTRSEFQLSWKS